MLDLITKVRLMEDIRGKPHCNAYLAHTLSCQVSKHLAEIVAEWPPDADLPLLVAASQAIELDVPTDSINQSKRC